MAVSPKRKATVTRPLVGSLRPNTNTLPELIRRMQDYLVPGRNSTEDLRLDLISVPDLDDTSARAAVIDNKNAPAIAASKSGAAGNFEDVRRFPYDDAGLYAISVAQTLWRVNEIRDYIDTLFLHSEGGNLCKSCGLHQTDSGPQRVISTPALEKGRRAGFDIDSIGCQNVRHNFYLPGIANHNDWAASQHHAFALLNDTQNTPRDGRVKRDHLMSRISATYAHEARPGDLHRKACSHCIESGCLQLLTAGDFRVPRLFQRLRGDDLFVPKLLCAFAIPLRLFKVLPGMFRSRIGLTFGSLGSRDASQDLLALLLV